MLGGLSNQPVTIIIGIFLAGLLIGSFVNVLIHRIPKMILHNSDDIQPINLAYPPSHCPRCKHKLAIWQLIPIISYIMLKGRCHYCREKIADGYTITEVVCMLVTVLCFIYFGVQMRAVAACILSYVLIALIAIDAKHHILPDMLTLPGLWLGLLFNSYIGIAHTDQAIFGAVAGYLILWFVAFLYQLVRRKHGMGHGDMKMLAMLGAWFGIAWVFTILFIGVILALISATAMLITKQLDKGEPLPFGPYLALGGWLVLFLQPELINFLGSWLS